MSNRLKCSDCGGTNIWEMQWHHTNKRIKGKDGNYYHLINDGSNGSLNTSYCDNDYFCEDCDGTYDQKSGYGCNPILDKGENYDEE